MTNSEPPQGLSDAGQRLWQAIAADFELGEHELVLLREAAATADQIDQLQAVIVSEGPMVDSPQGRRTHPAVIETRQQRITLARLLAALRIPMEDEEDVERKPVRAPRGVYRP